MSTIKEVGMTCKVTMGGINIDAKVNSVEILDDRIIIYTDHRKEESNSGDPKSEPQIEFGNISVTGKMVFKP